MLRQKRIRPSGPVLPTTPQTTLTQKQSLELMKTIITATISHILWARRVFPKITYRLRSYDPADPEISYSAFVEGVKGKPPSFEPSENLMIWKILPRSQDSAVDKVLDCLEIGAFDALSQGYLSKLQVSLHSIDEKPVDDSNLIESYTMIFEYNDGYQLKVCSKLQNKSIIIQSAKKCLYELVNDVGFLIYHINRHRSTDAELPEQFRMLLSLMYNDKASENYQPPMFRPGNSNSIKILESGHPNPNLRMKTGFHRLKEPLIVTAIANANSVTIGVHIPENNQVIPIRELPVRNATTTVVDKPSAHEVGSVAYMSSPTTAIVSTQAEGNPKNLSLSTQDTLILGSSVSETIGAPIVANKKEMHTDNFVYTQPILDRVKLAGVQQKRPRDFQNPLKCECVIAAHEEALFCCVICLNLKHTRCYGYLDETPPLETVCYTCLLTDNDAARIEEVLKPLSIKRRALYYLREKGLLVNSADLASCLNMPKTRVSRILGDFKVDGLLKGSRKDRKKAPMATYTGNDEKLRMLYFRPQLGIEHLLTLPKKLIPATFGLKGLEKSFVGPDEEVRNLRSATQDEEIRQKSFPNNSYATNCQDHQFTLSLEVLNSSQVVRDSFDQRTNESKVIPQSISLEGSSTQGTPSPRITTGKSQYEGLGNQDQRACTESLGKHSSIESKANSTQNESNKRLKVGNVSPWLIRNL